jgi:hypothetical protein
LPSTTLMYALPANIPSMQTNSVHYINTTNKCQ